MASLLDAKNSQWVGLIRRILRQANLGKSQVCNVHAETATEAVAKRIPRTLDLRAADFPYTTVYDDISY